MKKTTATPQTITAAAVYGAQRAAAALKAAHRATIAARAWLRASHVFYAQDGDPSAALDGNSSATT